MARNDDPREQIGLMNALRDSLNEASAAMRKTRNDQQAMESDFASAAEVLRTKTIKNLESYTETLSGMPKILVAASAAARGFSFTLNLTGNIVKVGLGAFQALASTVLGVVDSFADFSIGLFKDAMQEANDNILAVINATATLTGQFGDLSHGTGEMAKNMAKGANNIKGARYQDQLSQVGQAASSTGSAFRAMGREMGPKAQKRFGKTFTALTLGAGVSGEAMDALASQAIGTGGSFAKIAKQVAGDIGYMAKKTGISSKEIGKDFSFLMTNMDTYGTLTAETAVKTATYFRSMGIEASKVAGVMKKFNTFKDAAETVGLLNQAFGVQLDAYKMMNEQDPAKQFEMLRRSVLRAPGGFERMTRQQQQYMAQLSGMDVATARVAFSDKMRGKSLDEINKKMKDASPQERMAKGMRQLNKAIQPVTSYIIMFTDFFHAMYVGVKRALAFMIPETSKFFNSLQFSFQRTEKGAMDFTAVIIKAFPGLRDFIVGITELFKPGNITKMFKGFNKSIGKFLRGGAKDFDTFGDDIVELFDDIFGKTMSRDLTKSLKKMGKTILDGLTGAVKWVTKQTVKLLDLMIDGLTGGGKHKAKAQKGMFKNLKNALTDAFNKVGPKVTELVVKLGSIIGEKLWKAVTNTWDNMSGGQKALVFGYLFGPAVMNAVGALAAQTMGPMIATKLAAGLQSGAAQATVGKGLTFLFARALPVLGAFVAGYKIGEKLDEWTGISDWVSGTSGPLAAEAGAIDKRVQHMKDAQRGVNREAKLVAKGAGEYFKNLTKSDPAQFYNLAKEGHFKTTEAMNKRFAKIQLKALQDQNTFSAKLQTALTEQWLVQKGKNSIRELDAKQQKTLEKMVATRMGRADAISKKQRAANYLKIKELKAQILEEKQLEIERASGGGVVVPPATPASGAAEKAKAVMEKVSLYELKNIQKMVKLTDKITETKLDKMKETVDMAAEILAGLPTIDTAKVKKITSGLSVFVTGVYSNVPSKRQIKRFKDSMGALREYKTDAINFYKALEGGGQYLSGKLVKGGGGAVNINLGVNLEIDGFKLAEVLDETYGLTEVNYNRDGYRWDTKANQRVEMKPKPGALPRPP